jgi:hypothetical protein
MMKVLKRIKNERTNKHGQKEDEIINSLRGKDLGVN